MRVNRLIIGLMLCFAVSAIMMSCTKDDTSESPIAPQTLSEQIQGDWKLVQCNETVPYVSFSVGGLWKFFMNSDSPLGEIWINGVFTYNYVITGNMIRIYRINNDSLLYDKRYTLEITNDGNTMRLMELDSDELKLDFSKI